MAKKADGATTYGRPSYFLGHVSGGKIYYDVEHGTFSKLEQVLARAKSMPWSPNRLVIESRNAKRHGTVYGTSTRYLSAIDGALLPYQGY